MLRVKTENKFLTSLLSPSSTTLDSEIDLGQEIKVRPEKFGLLIRPLGLEESQKSISVGPTFISESGVSFNHWIHIQNETQLIR